MDSVTAVMSSQILFGLNFHEPEVNTRLFAPYGDQGASMFLMLKMLGAGRPVAQESYSFFEKGRIHETFIVRANVADPGAGNDILISLAALSVDASNRFYPQLGDDILFANEVVGRVELVNIANPAIPVLTVSPKEVTDNIGALTAGDEVVIYSNSFGEGSAMPGGRVTKPTEYSNNLKIIKSVFAGTGTEMTNKAWAKIYDETGKTFLGWYNHQLDVDLSYRHNLAISSALLVDKIVTNTAKVIDALSQAGSNVAQGTDGLITLVKQRGIPVPVASGAFTLASLYSLSLELDKQFAGDDYMLLSGNKRAQNIEQALKTVLNDTGVDYSKNVAVKELLAGQSNAEAKSVSLAFSDLFASNRWWHLKTMPEFKNPAVLGADGFPYADMTIGVPMGKTKDAKTGELSSYCGYRYKELGGNNRFMQTWTDGAGGPTAKVGPVDIKYDYVMSHLGFEGACMNKFFRIYAP